jgi:hypothetical protein
LIPGAPAKIVATLYYQTTSKEFVEFLRDENYTDNQGNVIYDLWVANGKCPPVVMEQDSIFVDPIELPAVFIDMIPDNPPVTVPAGGFFTFTGILINNTDQPQTTDVWIMVGLPQGGQFGPLQQFNNIPLPPFDTLIAPGARQNIPLAAPLGTYDYIAYCGDYPSSAIDSASFEFEIIAPLTEGSEEWDLTRWFDTGDVEIPTDVALLTSYPNPFNAETRIHYQIPIEGNVKIEVFNVGGQIVKTLVDGIYQAGEHSVSWSADDVNSGVYFIKLSTSDKNLVKKITLIK